VSDLPWYQTSWNDVGAAPWAQDTVADVNFVCSCLGLSRSARILDLACGTGRHSLELARRGHDVVGVDLCAQSLTIGREIAVHEGLSARFMQMDVRDFAAAEEFDVVLNLWEGAIGYFETEQENARHVAVIAKSLRAGGLHLAGPLYNAACVSKATPRRLWSLSKDALFLSELSWLEETRQVRDVGWQFFRDEQGLWRLALEARTVEYRIYSPTELAGLFGAAGLRTTAVYHEPGREMGAAAEHLEFWIRSEKVR